jgi:hypothetical protein
VRVDYAKTSSLAIYRFLKAAKKCTSRNKKYVSDPHFTIYFSEFFDVINASIYLQLQRGKSHNCHLEETAYLIHFSSMGFVMFDCLLDAIKSAPTYVRYILR